MFCLVAFVLAAVGQELWRGTVARRTMTGESWPRGAGRGSSRRNRRRYGGYLVHAGIAVLFLGVAASSAFLDQRDVRLSPGRVVRGRRLRGHLREATAKLRRRPAGTGAPISFGAVLDVRKDGKHFVLRPLRNYYPSSDPSLGTISRFFEGEATSEVDVRWGLSATSGWRCAPTSASLEGPIREADAKFADSPGDVQALIVAALAENVPQRPAARGLPAIASPLVAWIWIGGGDRVPGRADRGWPSPEARLRRVRSLYAARVAPRALARVDAGGCTRSPCWCSPRRRGSCCGCRCAAAARRSGARRRAAELRPPRRRSTARSATPSSTTARASSREEDWRSVDRDLRGEAIEILRQLDRLEGRSPDGGMDR